jgi:hypothetical protein
MPPLRGLKLVATSAAMASAAPAKRLVFSMVVSPGWMVRSPR